MRDEAASANRPEKSLLASQHVWDSNYKLSNWINFGVQRHASHHLAPRRYYPTHVDFDDSPELPFGYPTMIMIALCTPLWMKVMNSRLPRIRAYFNERGLRTTTNRAD